jgi:NAD+ synthase (glutamine-hydrolysing)
MISRPCRVALAQIAPALGDLRRNLALHLQQIDAARRQGAHAIVFPELSLTGYYLRDMVPDVALTTESPELQEIVAAAGDMSVAIGFVERDARHRYYNSAAWIEQGKVAHVHRKVYLPTYGMFDEQRYFAAGHRIRAGVSQRMGRVGLIICEDFWHLSVATILQADDADWLICLANSPARGLAGPEIRTAETYRHIAQTYAQLMGVVVVVVNRAGVEEGLTFWGGSLVVGPGGDVLAAAPTLDSSLTLVDVDPADMRRQRLGTPLGRDERLLLTIEELQRAKRRLFDETSASENHDENNR